LSSGTAKKYRVAYLREIESEGLQPEIKKSITDKLDQLKKNGHTVEPVDFCSK